MLDSDLCENGCGHPRAVVGAGDFAVTLKLCRDCGTALEALEAQQVKRSEQLVRLDADLGPALARRELETFPCDSGRGEALAKAATWLDGCLAGASRNLYLCGPEGEGKTGLAAALARKAAEAGVVSRFYVGRDWLDAVRKAQFQDGGDDPERAARSTRLLVLDDIGTERGTAFALERLLSLVDHRYRHELPTIVTSNFTPAELRNELGKTDEMVGRRIVSRLVEDVVQARFAYGNLRLRPEIAAA